jgi:predicted phage tail protein
MKNIIFEGFIGDKYGREWNIRANTVRDALNCLEANYPESRKDLIEFVEAGGNFSIQVGEEFLGEEELFYNITKDTIIITPIPAGAKSGGAKVVAGLALLTFAFFMPQMFLFLNPATGGGFAGAAVAAGNAVSAFLPGTLGGFIQSSIALLGVSLATTGLQQMMAPDPSVDTNDNNYLFEGPDNTIATGNPVPVLFGQMIVGGVVISSGTVTGAVRTLSTYGSSDSGGGGYTGPTYPPDNIDTFNSRDPDTGGGFTTTQLIDLELRMGDSQDE